MLEKRFVASFSLDHLIDLVSNARDHQEPDDDGCVNIGFSISQESIVLSTKYMSDDGSYSYAVGAILDK